MRQCERRYSLRLSHFRTLSFFHLFRMTHLELKKHVPSGTVALQRPARRNALDRELLRALRQAFGDFHQERKVRAVILTGVGDVFSAGMDLAEMKATISSDDALQQWHQDVTLYKELLEVMLRFPKPIIAAVNGPALGAGAGLVLASDIVLASPQASFGFTEPRRGLVSGLLIPLLQFRVGGGCAAKMLLTAEACAAEEALRVGLCHELVANDLLWARAHELAGVVARSAPEAIQLTKKVLNETVGEQLATWLSAGAAASATARTTEAAAEGVAAFLEKREPEWP